MYTFLRNIKNTMLKINKLVYPEFSRVLYTQIRYFCVRVHLTIKKSFQLLNVNGKLSKKFYHSRSKTEKYLLQYGEKTYLFVVKCI